MVADFEANKLWKVQRKVKSSLEFDNRQIKSAGYANAIVTDGQIDRRTHLCSIYDAIHVVLTSWPPFLHI